MKKVVSEPTVPEHIAIIMDGNGRWALANGYESRLHGHTRGAKVLMEIMDESVNLGVKYLTCYTFSTENWKRTDEEVNHILSTLLPTYLKLQEDYMMKKGVRFKAIGEIDMLPDEAVKVINKVVDITKDNENLVVTLALNYGGRQEILRATKEIAQECVYDKRKLALIDENEMRKHLYDPSLPDPDLLIRTSGEMRLSNFLPWQLVYTELWTTDILWPDFKREDFREAIISYSKRHRRYGGNEDG